MTARGVDPAGHLAMAIAFDGTPLDARCRLRTASEHLLTFDLIDPVCAPPLGTMVDLEIGGRAYRSTVQASGAQDFVLLRPRALESLQLD